NSTKKSLANLYSSRIRPHLPSLSLCASCHSVYMLVPSPTTAITIFNTSSKPIPVPPLSIVDYGKGNLVVDLYCMHEQYFSKSPHPHGQPPPGAAHGAGLRAGRLSQPG